MADCKKVLIVSHNALSLHSNNGKTLSSLFQDWPVNNLAQLYFLEEMPESLGFNKFFRVTDFDVLKAIVFFWRRNICGVVLGSGLPVEGGHSHRMGVKLKSKIIKLINKFNSLKLIFRNSIFGTNFWESKKLLDWVVSFCPDVIFFVGGDSLFSFRIALRLSSLFEIPLYIYITDDYISSSKGAGFFKKILQKQLLDVYRSSFLIAREVFVIGDDMACEFEKLFNRKFIPVMNSVDIRQQAIVRIRDFMGGSEPVDVVYAGGLHLGRDNALCDFGRILKQLSMQLGLPIKLSVYSMAIPENIIIQRFKKEEVFFCGSLSGERLSERLSVADFLLHVESFDFNYRNKTRLSISTKIPEYLATGVCLIAYGPAEVASIRLVGKNKIGLSITDDDDEVDKIMKLNDIFLNPIKRRDFAFEGLKFAHIKFNGEKTRSLLLRTLN